ncbi:type 4 prepilin peptidase 1 Aspartic peptidase. MEROPS family A24A [Sulfurivirga caldicuralii]|uniref:Prepilin leader peptidase/N-methyltransferase n=1 Tax=Sulfurivirga caldicuralii TaxID=364032 RepID=A0A1N6F6E4_9GAMM|nr:A24 family peptidase [Sulfurivirga caldicuralii]SIN90868.1 type 4 prepilin peptidase 1 Aspartic peptidase. MEROPS family A24A [Sulfurivirga caldicuralii]
MHDPPILFAAFVIGLIFGSFFSMLSWRWPRKLIAEYEGNEVPPILDLKTRSQCLACHTELPPTRLIPLFSWLASRGRCHACGTPISLRYPLIELATALLTVLAVYQFGMTLQGALAVAFSWLLLLITVIDLEHQLILDALSLPLLWLGLVASAFGWWSISAQEAIFGAALGYLILWGTYWVFRLVTGKEGMGYGDFKLLAALGAWFGPEAIPALILISALSGLVIQLSLRLIGRGSVRFAFGPYLALAGLMWLYWGEAINRQLLMP